jgi:hypothetical protein
MNVPTPSADAEKSLPTEGDVEAEICKLVEQEVPKLAPQIVNDGERIRSSVARLTSSSINDLEGLMSELQQLQEFLKSEVGRMQREIDSVLEGVKIIVETIAPWKSITDPVTPPAKGTRGVLGGPAANITSASLPYGKAP